VNLFYDRKGQPISRDEFVLQWQPDTQIVARFQDERILISTVWLGIDHQFGVGKPLIFETMVFVNDPAAVDPKYDNLQWRWHTEEQAKEAHDIIVACYRENKDPEEAINKWQMSFKS